MYNKIYSYWMKFINWDNVYYEVMMSSSGSKNRRRDNERMHVVSVYCRTYFIFMLLIFKKHIHLFLFLLEVWYIYMNLPDLYLGFLL
jgi:hypothetical protein